MRYLVPILLILTACGEWPDAGGPPLTRDTRPWPKLVPIDQVSAPSLEVGNAEARRLASRAAALRARAAILRRSASTQAEMEALRARLRP